FSGAKVQKRWLRKRLIYVKLQGRSVSGYGSFSYFVKQLSTCLSKNRIQKAELTSFFRTFASLLN
ncbi:hypothetical protein, partial [Bacteroides xylanisolvens]|uniref:hypothetical protein n=1 Tax=Bacteroides xylanisolvens TaxID=371601 RepID=UPI001961A508